MKKIAFILHDLTGGGAERTVSNLSFQLSKSYDFYAILFDADSVNYPFNGTILGLNAPAKDGTLQKMINVLKRVHRLRKIKKKYQFDVCVGFQFSACLVNILSKSGEKLISSARNFISAYGTNRVQVFKEHFAASKADKVVAISEMVRRDLITSFRVPEAKTLTIYNPCDVKRIREYAEQPIEYKFDKNEFYFINIGRLVRQKGQWDLLKAFSLVAGKYKNVRLLVLGGFGNLDDELKELSVNLKIDDRVDFVGFQDNPFAYLKQADAFVLTSLHEGLGNVILEAMACGTPVISTDCYAGPREILAPHSDFADKAYDVEKEEFGILTPEISTNPDFSCAICDNHKKLAKAMEMLYLDEHLRSTYAARASERLKDFSPDKIAVQWNTLFDSLTEE